MRRLAFLLVLTLGSSSAIPAPEKSEPSTWQEFNENKDNKDPAILLKISKTKWWHLCDRYGKLRRAKAKTREFYAVKIHLLTDNMLSGIDLMHIPEKTIEIGMTQCGVFASLGQPSRVNNTTNSRGTSSQLVYEHGNYPYVYTEEMPGYQTQAVRSFRH